MDDSFFGFDVTLPEGGGCIEEPSEEEYDALNDETFGAAINGDWEEAHESLVRLNDDSVPNSGFKNGRKDKKSSTSKVHLHDEVDDSESESLRSRSGRKNLLDDSDLDLNLSNMKLDDVDLNFDDVDTFSVSGVSNSTNFNLGPSVWGAQPEKLAHSNTNVLVGRKGHDLVYEKPGNISTQNFSPDPINILRDNFSNPFQKPPLLQQPQQLLQQNQQQQLQYMQKHHLQLYQSQLQQQQKFEDGIRKAENFAMPRTNSMHDFPPVTNVAGAQKFRTLEDLERNLIQQGVQKQIESANLSREDLVGQLHSQMSTPAPIPLNQPYLQQNFPQLQQQAHLKGGPFALPNQQLPNRPVNNFANNISQHPLGNLLQPKVSAGVMGNSLAPGFPVYPPGINLPQPPPCQIPQIPPHPLLNQPGLPPNFPPHQIPLPSSHLPVALNNFAMHPNFNAIRAAGMHPAGLLSPQQQQIRMPQLPIPIVNGQQPHPMVNMMKLVQEMQHNTALLQNSLRMQHNGGPNVNGFPLHQLQLLQQQQQHQQQQQRNSGGNKHYQHRDGKMLAEEYDDYANLMTTRDKHWLIGIQLSQLNTDTPYIDDYYYTVYKERKAGEIGHSQAHKDNQLNHPLTQPHGHAQLVLVQLGNKNGTRNGQHRDRRTSENTNNNTGGSGKDQRTPYVCAPLRFENSLGKLQFGSVTAPRKIIDADVVGGEMKESGFTSRSSRSISPTALQLSAAGVFGEAAATAQRKSRHVLLHIETLYQYVHKLEDLDNPQAIETILLKKRKEAERIAALEALENANKTPEEKEADAVNPQSNNPASKNKFVYDIETKDALLVKVIAGLTNEKIIAMMNIRKGKILIRRIMPFLDEYDDLWDIWITIFSTLPIVVKKDREDAEGLLYGFYDELLRQIKGVSFEVIIRIAHALPLSDKKANCVFCSKFGIAALVCLIIHAEGIFVDKSDVTFNSANRKIWRQFLDTVATSLTRAMRTQTICAAIDAESIQPMMNHFARFKDLKLDSLLALITEAKQQIK